MGSIIGLVVGGVSSFFSGLFGLKGKQADVIQQAIKAASDLNNSEAQREMAQAQILAAELQSESWLARSWRPILMLICIGILVSFWFGYVPPNFDAPMSPMMSEIFGLIKVGLGGYIGARSVEKIFKTLNLGKALKAFVEKKIL